MVQTDICARAESLALKRPREVGQVHVRIGRDDNRVAAISKYLRTFPRRGE